jgi:Retrotransposon gag protein
MAFPQPTFNGHANEDYSEYLEMVECNAETRNGEAKNLFMRVSFRSGLQGKASAWYKELEKATREDWSQLKAAFETKYSPDVESFDKTFLIQQEVYNLKQAEKETDAQYIRRIEKLNERCPATLQSEVARRTLGGLRDVNLQYRVQNHLLSSKKIDPSGELVKDIKFGDIRNALGAAARLIGKPSPFELDEADGDHEYRIASQAELNYEMLKALNALHSSTSLE